MRRKCLNLIIAVLLLCGIAQADWRFNPYTQKLDYTVYSRATATGDIIYHTGVVWNALNIGAAGTVLTVVGGVPTWAGGGGVLPISTVQFSILVADAVGGWTEDTLFRVNAGNVVAGTWTSTRIAPLYGGTGINTSLATGVPFIVAGAWGTNAVVTVAYGGTGVANLTDHGIMLGSGAAAVTVSAVGAGGQLFQSLGAGLDPVWTTSTWPATTTINQILYSIAANSVVGLATANSGLLVTSAGGVPSIATDIPTTVTIGGAYVYRTGGTDVPVTDGGTGVSTLTNHGVVIGQAAAAVTITAAGTANQVLQSGGAAADPVWSTATYPATTTINRLLYSSANNTITDLATGNSSVLVTSAGGVPSLSTDIPTAVTIGTAYIYRVGGTDMIVADGGTGRSTSTTAYGLLAAGTTATNPHQTLAAGLVTQILVGGGAAALPAWGTDIPTAVTIGGQYVYRVGGTDVAATDGGTGLGVYVVGDLLYASAVNALSRLADVALGQVLISGGVGVAPSWSGTPSVLTLDVNYGGATGESGVDFNSINNTFATMAQSDAEGIAVSSDTRLGLDETLRNLIICDRGDIATDFGRPAATHPTLYLFDNTGNSHARITFVELKFQSGNVSMGYNLASDTKADIFGYTGVRLRSNNDLAAGNMFVVDSVTDKELTDANAEQAWMYIEDKYNQTSTAAGGSILVKSLLTSSGDASSGKGYNFFADFRIDDTNDTSLYNIARYHIAKVHTSDLFDAAGLTDSVTIWTQPANSRLENVVIVLEAQFVAVGMTDLDVTIGDVGDNTGILLETMNLTSDAVGADYSLKGAYWSATTAGSYYTAGAKAWLAYSTAVGANLNTTSAGEVIFYFIYTQY